MARWWRSRHKPAIYWQKDSKCVHAPHSCSENLPYDRRLWSRCCTDCPAPTTSKGTRCSGQAYVDLLLDSSVTGPSDTVSPEILVKHLVDTYSLDQLVHLTNRLAPEADVHEWVEKTAQPTPDAPEADRKAAIAHMLVQQAGVDVVRREVQL